MSKNKIKVKTVTKKPKKAKKKKTYYDFNKPFWAQNLGDEWDDYAWGADDF